MTSKKRYRTNAIRAYRPSAGMTYRPRFPLNTLAVQARRAVVLGEAANAEIEMQNAFNCGTDRNFPTLEMAITYAARLVVGSMVALDAARVPIRIIEPEYDGGSWLVLTGDDLADGRYGELACLASAIVASGREAQCDLCETPVKAVEQVRAIARHHALGVRAVEDLLRADPDHWHAFGRAVLHDDPEPTQGSRA